ncbi:MAG: HDOD domain-containing protein [Deltaproteobacteria bacterium]|nr:HDOD domain-containing protein [Deltaproteobacteria bacterium]MBW1963742.1 HDOD domain-containing protein [Deltaproteobacteria bacterium]MBW2079443.1 HDOD domain-containing protein [Deltaproteobacteria bacterium]MBW2349900.1 HDOD domain-containing protein [Deltaproteobacteria bacterium]
MQTQESLFRQIETQKHLPTLPHILLKLIDACKQDEENLKKVSKIIENDPSLSSKILNLVNSAYYGLPNRIEGMYRAVVLVGTNAIKNIAICASVYEVFDQTHGNSVFNLKSFWWHSLKCAVVAKLIAGKIHYTNPDEAFLSGLLHDIGKLVFWVNFPEQYRKLLETCKDQPDLLLEGERQLGATHSEVGAWLIRRWNLQSFLADSILYHHEPKNRILNALPLVQIVYVANALSHVQQQDEDYNIAEDLCGLSKSQVEELLSLAEEELKNVADLLGIEIEPPKDPGAILSEKDRGKQKDLVREVMEFSLLTGTLQNLLEANDENTIVRAAQQGIKVLFDIKSILFFLYDPEKKGLIYKASEEENSSSMISNLIIPMQADKSLLATSLTKGKPLESFTHFADTKLIIIDEQIIRFIGKEGMLCIPMLAHGEYVGVIVLGLDQVEFSHLSKSSMLLNMFSNNVALALHVDQVRRNQLNRIQSERLAASLSMARKVVHEVNNPLCIMKNYLKILGMKLSAQDPAQEEIESLNEEIDRITMILRSLTTFSEQRVCNFVPEDINVLLSNLIKIMAGFLSEHSNIKVHIDLEDELPKIITEKDSLKQVFINLIKNAVEVMPGGGNLYIKTRHISSYFEGELESEHTKYQGYVQITITDEGPGISDEIKPRLFEPFVTSKGHGHSGLGLSIVYEIIKSLNGTLAYESEEGKGTSFKIGLPVVTEQEF